MLGAGRIHLRRDVARCARQSLQGENGFICGLLHPFANSDRWSCLVVRFDRRRCCRQNRLTPSVREIPEDFREFRTTRPGARGVRAKRVLSHSELRGAVQ